MTAEITWLAIGVVIATVVSIALYRALRGPRYDIPAQYRRGAQIIKNPPPKGAIIPRELYDGKGPLRYEKPGLDAQELADRFSEEYNDRRAVVLPQGVVHVGDLKVGQSATVNLQTGEVTKTCAFPHTYKRGVFCTLPEGHLIHGETQHRFEEPS